MHCLWFLFLYMSFAVDYSLCKKELSRMYVRGVTGEVEAALKKMHLETSLEKNCFLGYIVSRIQKPSKVLSIYLIHSFIHLKEH